MRQKIIAGMTTPEREEWNGFPAALRAIEGEAGVGSVVGTKAYLGMVSNLSASLKKARQAALDKNDGSLFGIVPLGKLERKKSRAVTESDCAAAFGEWRVALVRVFSDLFLLHCLFGFEEAGNDSGKIAGFCSLLMVRYASGGAAAPWGAFERLGDLARKPVQRGIVAV